jgi:hypothetical protein
MAEIVPPQRCCSSHANWPQLTQHLVEGFPDIPLVEIVGLVSRTREAEARFGLPEDQHLETAEAIVRNQLMQLAGMSGAPPRLGAQPHGDRTHVESSGQG